MKAHAFRCGLTVVAVVAVLVAVSGPAWGHAAYSGSDPPDEGVVSRPPSEVVAEFTEPPAEGSSLSIVDACGQRVDNGDSVTSGFEVRVTMSSSSKGTYTVAYRVTSDYDSHVTTGEFTFSSTGGDDCAGEGSAERDDGERERERSDQGTSDDGGDEAAVQEASGSDGGDSSAAGRERTGGRERERRPSGRDRGRPDAELDRAAPETFERVRDRAPWDGIELSDFLVGMGLAVLIGAAGGKVYAGIVGPAGK